MDEGLQGKIFSRNITGCDTKQVNQNWMPTEAKLVKQQNEPAVL